MFKLNIVQNEHHVLHVQHEEIVLDHQGGDGDEGEDQHVQDEQFLTTALKKKSFKSFSFVKKVRVS